MARKDLLKDLMAAGGKSFGDAPTPPAPTQSARGAIGAVSRSVADLQARAVMDIDARMIDDAGVKDRLDDPDLAALIDSIAAYGQQVPVLLRVNPNDEQRYQVAFGRRRVAAAKVLGVKVKALVRVLDDKALVIAQGQENTARKDLSFIEKANFARQMRDGGYDRKIICDALHVDKTVISRMLQIADAVPVELVEAIGAAPSVGRDRWLALAGALKGRDLVAEAQGDSSGARFEAVMAALTVKKPKAAPPAPQKITQDGAEIAKIKGAQITVTEPDFAAWLSARLAELHRDWKTRGEE